MKLRYINIWLMPDTGYSDDYRSTFLFHTRFISHYLSINIRKFKIETDGTFDMISIAPRPKMESAISIRGANSLSVRIPFDEDKYEQIKGTENYEYYLDLYRKGFEEASKYKEIPLDLLNNMLQDFKNGGYKNEWLFKRKKLKEYDVEISLICHFTTLDFRLSILAKRISNKEKLIEGTLIRTLPDEIYFGKMFNNIMVSEGEFIVTYGYGSPRIILKLDDILNKDFKFELTGDEDIKRIFSYDGSGFAYK